MVNQMQRKWYRSITDTEWKVSLDAYCTCIYTYSVLLAHATCIFIRRQISADHLTIEPVLPEDEGVYVCRFFTGDQETVALVSGCIIIHCKLHVHVHVHMTCIIHTCTCTFIGCVYTMYMCMLLSGMLYT